MREGQPKSKMPPDSQRPPPSAGGTERLVIVGVVTVVLVMLGMASVFAALLIGEALRRETPTPTSVAIATPPTPTPIAPATATPTAAQSPEEPSPRPTSTTVILAPTATLRPTFTPGPVVTPTKPPPPPPATPPPETAQPFKYPAVALQEPPEEARLEGPITFRWRSVGRLQGEEQYQLQVWRGDELITRRLTQEERYVLDDIYTGSGAYQWDVVIVRGEGQASLSPPSERWSFEWKKPKKPEKPEKKVPRPTAPSSPTPPAYP